MSFRNLSKTFRYVNENGGEIIFAYENGFVINKPNGIDVVSVSHSQAQGINQVGSTIQSSNIQSRPVTISGIFAGSAETQKKNKSKLISIIRPDLSARLYADDYYLEVRPTATPVIEPRPLFANFQFSMLAAYPYWQKDASASARLSGVRKMFKFPWNISGGGSVHSIEGATASFDVNESLPLMALSANISPVQDFNGYDKPWVGGAVRNIQDPNDMVEGYLSSSGTIHTPSATQLEYSSANYIPIPTGTTTVSFGYNNFESGDSRWSAICLYDESYTHIVRYNPTYSGAYDGIGSISLSSVPNAKYLKFSTRTFGHGLDGCYLAFGSEKSFVPYSNICPITAFSAVNIYQEDEYDQSAVPVYTLNLNGTRGRGSLNVLTGVLTIDREFIQLDGNSSVALSSSGSTTPPEILPYWAAINVPATAKSDYNYENWMFSHGLLQTAAYAGIFRASYLNATSIRIVIGTNTLCNTTALVQSWLQDQYDLGTPLQIVYELATPLTVQLTAQQVDTLVGRNVIWADTGDVSVTYMKSTPTPYRFGEVIQAQFINITNDGQVPVPFTVTFDALEDVENPKLIEASTNEYLLLNKTLVAGERVVVEITHDRTYVTSSIDGECRGALDLGSSFNRLKVGDNVIKPEATSGKDRLQVTIDYAAEIVGVAV